MRITRLSHSGFLIETAKARAIIDPWLYRHSSDSVRLTHEAPFAKGHWAKIKLNALIISHDHLDHFHLPSLALFDRRTTIVYPLGQTEIPRFCRQLGFRKFKPLAPWQKTRVGDLSLVATPSLETLPEMGVLFTEMKSAVRFWNTVDSSLTEPLAQELVAREGAVDLMTVSYRSYDYSRLFLRDQKHKIETEFWRHSLNLPVWTRPHMTMAVDQGWSHENDSYINDRVHAFSAVDFRDSLRKRGYACNVWKPWTSIDIKKTGVITWAPPLRTTKKPRSTEPRDARPKRIDIETDLERFFCGEFYAFLQKYPLLLPRSPRCIELQFGKARDLYLYGLHGAPCIRRIARRELNPNVSVLRCDARTLWRVLNGEKSIDVLGMGGGARFFRRGSKDSGDHFPDPLFRFLHSHYRHVYYEQLTRADSLRK